MALNRTQCPHCFTTYVISDEQFRVSEGMVRCGTCRERFQARLLSSSETPKFDPRNVFIEPLTEEAPHPASKQNDESIDIEFADPHTESHAEIEQADSEPLEHSSNRELSADSEDVVDTGFSPPSELNAETTLAEMQANQQRDADHQQSPKPAQQTELDLPLPGSTSQQAALKTPTHSNESSPTPPPNKQATIERDTQLIDEVDQLVNHKLVTKPSLKRPTAPIRRKKAIRRPVPRPQKRPSKFRKIMAGLVLLVLIPGLSATLVYQLWLKQLLVFPPNSSMEQIMLELVEPVGSALSERGFELPVRRNLSRLELLSARTEPHPERSSTILLRVSLINHAEISQPLPWLELSLTDADGRLVSRRQLRPQDYLYNNNTTSQIGARELKKVTIELLSFPKQATGYELKLLNR